MVNGSRIWVYYLAKIDDYPNIKKEFPNAKYMDMGGNKFMSIEQARNYYKQSSRYKQRKYKPVIRIVVVDKR